MRKPTRFSRRASDQFKSAIRNTSGITVPVRNIASVFHGLQSAAFSPESVRKAVKKELPSISGSALEKIVKVERSPHLSPREQSAALIGAYHNALYGVRTPKETQVILKRIAELATDALQMQRESKYGIRRKNP